MKKISSVSKIKAASVVGVAAILLIAVSAYKKPTPPKIDQVKHMVVIYMENHSFDNLYGQFEGADGLAQAKTANVTQMDAMGQPYPTLQPIPNSPAFPTDLPNTYFNIDQYVAADLLTPDVTHQFYQEQMQINGGKMDRFALYNNSKGLTMGYYKTNMIPLYELAKKYTLCDRFFHSAFGGSFLNHQWLIAAASPVFPNAPASIVAQLDASGKMIKDGSVTPDGYAVNTSNSVNLHPKNAAIEKLVPNQNAPTIGDRLSDKNISWAWYAGGWNKIVGGESLPSFSYHHQPFAYFTKYAEGTAARKEHLKDEEDFLAAAKNGTLPAVSFVKPTGPDNEHPGSSTITRAEKHAVDLINAVLNGPNGKDAVIISNL